MKINPSRNTKETLRWFILFPGAIACGLIAQFMVYWFVSHARFDWREPSDGGNSLFTSIGIIDTTTFAQLATVFFTPFIVIIVGASIAPRHRIQTAIILALILIAAYGVSSPYLAQEFVKDLDTFVRLGRQAVILFVCIAGIAAGLINVRVLHRNDH